VHRVAQFVGHLTARVSADDEQVAHKILPAGAWGLFDEMPVADRRHGLDVAQLLLAEGIDDRDLLAAALLHDAAKGRRLRLWHRVGGVLLARLAPRTLHRLASPDPAKRGRGNPWWVFVHHARLSAEAALGAGLNERTAAFIAGTAGAADQHLASALHAADEAS
jgi:hypothetical protein